MRRHRIATAAIAALVISHTAAVAAGDGCRQGFVWREAFPGDHVCVVPEIRAQAWSDNAQAYSRINRFNHDYGPDTCVGGYVWREASRTDHVCVTPDVRTQAARDNAAAPGRFANAAGGGYAGPVQRPYSTGSYNPAWQAAPGDTSCCPNNMLICPVGRHFCGH